jgi:hypothetical protein
MIMMIDNDCCLVGRRYPRYLVLNVSSRKKRGKVWMKEGGHQRVTGRGGGWQRRQVRAAMRAGKPSYSKTE